MTSALTDHTGYWLRLVSNAVSQDFARAVAGEGVTVAEWAFLRTLHDLAPTSPTALAEHMGMTRGAISKLSDRLVAKALVARADSPQDKRAHILSLTAAGRAKMPVLATLADANDARFFGVLTSAQHEALGQILKRLADHHGLKTTPVD
jgi:DNA-binding MarR family transcriptional regulator